MDFAFLMNLIASIAGAAIYDGIKTVARRESDTSQKA